MRHIIFAAVFCLWPLSSFASLSCSANGTQIFYINGVNVTENDFFGLDNSGNSDSNKTPTYKTIYTYVKTYRNEIDEKGNVPMVAGIYNYSEGLFNDVEKLKNQLLLNYFPNSSQSSDDYYRAMLRKELKSGLKEPTVK